MVDDDPRAAVVMDAFGRDRPTAVVCVDPALRPAFTAELAEHGFEVVGSPTDSVAEIEALLAGLATRRRPVSLAVVQVHEPAGSGPADVRVRLARTLTDMIQAWTGGHLLVVATDPNAADRVLGPRAPDRTSVTAVLLRPRAWWRRGHDVPGAVGAGLAGRRLVLLDEATPPIAL